MRSRQVRSDHMGEGLWAPNVIWQVTEGLQTGADGTVRDGPHGPTELRVEYDRSDKVGNEEQVQHDETDHRAMLDSTLPLRPHRRSDAVRRRGKQRCETDCGHNGNLKGNEDEKPGHHRQPNGDERTTKKPEQVER